MEPAARPGRDQPTSRRAAVLAKPAGRVPRPDLLVLALEPDVAARLDVQGEQVIGAVRRFGSSIATARPYSLMSPSVPSRLQVTLWTTTRGSRSRSSALGECHIIPQEQQLAQGRRGSDWWNWKRFAGSYRALTRTNRG